MNGGNTKTIDIRINRDDKTITIRRDKGLGILNLFFT